MKHYWIHWYRIHTCPRWAKCLILVLDREFPLCTRRCPLNKFPWVRSFWFVVEQIQREYNFRRYPQWNLTAVYDHIGQRVRFYRAPAKGWISEYDRMKARVR